MISTKSEREIERMRHAGLIVALAREAVANAIKPGVSLRQLDEIAEKTIRENGATPSFKGYGGFPASICTSVNEVVAHGIPNDTVLKEGDIVSIDLGACYDGYHGDSAWTYAVGDVSDEARLLMRVTRNALFTGLKQAKPGNHLNDISQAIGEYVERYGYSIPIEFTGHGIGRGVHEEPLIPNIDTGEKGILLKEGMTLAIEPMVIVGRPFTKVLEDNWTVITKDRTLAAHFEHTILITKDGYEILTINREEIQSIYG